MHDAPYSWNSKFEAMGNGNDLIYKGEIGGLFIEGENGNGRD